MPATPFAYGRLAQFFGLWIVWVGLGLGPLFADVDRVDQRVVGFYMAVTLAGVLGLVFYILELGEGREEAKGGEEGEEGKEGEEDNEDEEEMKMKLAKTWWNPWLHMVFLAIAFVVSCLALGVVPVQWIGIVLLLDAVWATEAVVRERPFRAVDAFDPDY